MALNGFNAAAAAAILNNPRVGNADRTRGVALAAIAPGALGLAVPLVIAQQAARQKAAGPVPVPAPAPAPKYRTVPDVSRDHPTEEEAQAALTAAEFVPVPVYASTTPPIDIEEGRVIDQSPRATDPPVRRGSEVTIWVSAGRPSAPPAPPENETAALRKDLRTMGEALVERQTTATVALARKLDEQRAGMVGELQAVAATLGRIEDLLKTQSQGKQSK